MKYIIVISSIVIYCFICFQQNIHASLNVPISVDSRLKTLVYSPNEVFQLKFKPGYQTVICLEYNESINFISFGAIDAWTIKTIDNQVFLKTLEYDVNTNMIIATNKRTYYFELTSSKENEERMMDDQLVYRVKFFYPEVDPDAPVPVSTKVPNPNAPLPQPSTSKVPPPTGPKKQFNFNYSYAGTSERLLPQKIFDDGKSTYMQFKEGNRIRPTIYTVNDEGIEIPLKYELSNEYVKINSIEKQLSFRMDDELICVFNEMVIAADRVKNKKSGN